MKKSTLSAPFWSFAVFQFLYSISCPPLCLSSLSVTTIIAHIVYDVNPVGTPMRKFRDRVSEAMRQ